MPVAVQREVEPKAGDATPSQPLGRTGPWRRIRCVVALFLGASVDHLHPLAARAVGVDGQGVPLSRLRRLGDREDDPHVLVALDHGVTVVAPSDAPLARFREGRVPELDAWQADARREHHIACVFELLL